MSHYDTLEIDASATPEEIRAAYKRAAAKHHPDRGGNDATMAEVNRAYETLNDPERRTNYDATGDDEVRDITAEVRDALSELFNSVVMRGGDVIAHAREIAENKIAKLKQQRKGVEADIAHLKKNRQRIKSTSTVNAAHTVIDAAIQRHEHTLKELQHAITIVEIVSAELVSYSCDTDENVRPPHNNDIMRTMLFQSQSFEQAFIRYEP